MNKSKISVIIRKMHDMFPKNDTELVYHTPFQLIISVILSAQSTDKQVNKVTELLFKEIKSPEDILKIGFDKFESAIRSIGLYKSKAKNIYRLSEILILLGKDDLKTQKGQDIYKKHGYVIPDTIEELIKLPGIGIKTAKVIGHVLYGMRVVAVDTHVHRVVNRLGILKTDDPKKTSDLLEKLIPNDYKDIAHHAMILFGRYHCKSRKPRCTDCPFDDICIYFKNN